MLIVIYNNPIIIVFRINIKRRIPTSNQQTLAQCWFTVSPPSTTLVLYCKPTLGPRLMFVGHANKSWLCNNNDVNMIIVNVIHVHLEHKPESQTQ